LWEITHSVSAAMEQNLQDTIALLTRIPAALNALLRGLPETWTYRNEGENTWSPCNILGHLIHGERTDWMPRAKTILEFGETQTFEPFDREGFAVHILRTNRVLYGSRSSLPVVFRPFKSR
jgi:hypothetical protein